MTADRPTVQQVEAFIDTLLRAEPTNAQAHWRAAYDGLDQALRYARNIRRYCAIPAAALAAILVIAFHGERWDLDDIRNLFMVELLILLSLRFGFEKIFAVLEQEDQTVALLRYFGSNVTSDQVLT